jgi:uncharacterized membrane protein YtjA (UPF0391 family)
MSGLIYWAIIFLVIAFVFYLVGARGIAGLSMTIAKWLVIIFIVIAVLTFVLGAI